METVVIPGVPVEMQLIVNTLIGILASMLVGPATAIGKKWFHTEGVTTVAVSAALSTLVAVGVMIYQAAQGQLSWGGVLIGLIAFIRSNGEYLKMRQATKGGVEKAVTDPKPLPKVDDSMLGKVATAEDFAPSQAKITIE